VAGVVLLVVTPFAGHWSDKVGQIRITGPAAVLILVLIYPLFALLVAFPGFGVMLGMLAVIAVLKACYYGATGALMAVVIWVRLALR
jgi:MFS transporter, MHS family, proline/betaine transporter